MINDDKCYIIVAMWKYLLRIASSCSNALFNVGMLMLIAVVALYYYISISLPDVRQLRHISLQIPLRVYSADGKLIGEFGEKRCIPVKLNQVPTSLVNAFLDVEDQRFFEHKGVDFYGVMRAFRRVISTGRRVEGASTITMQVARNYFLGQEKTFVRKFNEILLAFNIDKYFSKREILELYLNKIYFGHRAYGVAAAAQVYYGKSLQELTLAEQAMLAGLPQSPSRNNPISNLNGALKRRNHVLLRMYENGHLTKQQYTKALAAKDQAAVLSKTAGQLEIGAHYLAEMVRQELYQRYGERVYQDGYEVITTLDSQLQRQAADALCGGLVAYDGRHDYRGVEGSLILAPRNQWRKRLAKFTRVGPLQAAVIMRVDQASGGRMIALLADGQKITLTRPQHWEYNWLPGDVVRVYRLDSAKKTADFDGAGADNIANNALLESDKEYLITGISQAKWRLSQLPEIEGAILALNPESGAILALRGGFSYKHSKFNRVVAAERQLGSLFKPFLYSAALEQGYTLASVINDAPIVIKQPGQPIWRPQNASGYFYGPTTLRTALTYSRNLVTIRLLQQMGVTSTIAHAKKFGFEGGKELPKALSLALGSGTVAPLKIAAAYATFANGGYAVKPYFIERILRYTPQGTELIFRAPQAYLAANARVISEQNCYLINDVLHEVMERGTASRAAVLKRSDLMGKTGSTNDLMDAWFVGYNRELLGLVWVGFDKPSGTGEYGSVAALPIWIDFMRKALADRPERGLEMPDGIVTAKIDKRTGQLLTYADDEGYYEKFIEGQLPVAGAEDGEDGRWVDDGSEMGDGQTQTAADGAMMPARARPNGESNGGDVGSDDEVLF